MGPERERERERVISLSLAWMGNCCWSTRVKAESPSFHHGSLNNNNNNNNNSNDNNMKKAKTAPPRHHPLPPPRPPSGDSSKGTKDMELVSIQNAEGGEIISSNRPSICLNVHPFVFNDLRAATRNFHHENLLGEGGFGCVYKGWLDEQCLAPSKPGVGMVIAVKKLNPEGLQGHKEWLAEVYYLGQLHHPNLVKLVGFCAEYDHRLLVYEFMQRGSLENHLFRRSCYHPLTWALRMKIALEAAKGLAFLHDAERQVIYRDFKTSNILLDSQYNAKLSDFGLAKDGPTGDDTHVSTRVMGTYGYAAPEYVATGHLTAKSDVYSFGVVLLEMLTGRRVFDKNRPGREQSLVEWAKPYVHEKNKVYYVVDSRLHGQFFTREAHKIASLAMYCLSIDPKIRPHMKEVVETLEHVVVKYSQNPRSRSFEHNVLSQYHDTRNYSYPQNVKMEMP